MRPRRLVEIFTSALVLTGALASAAAAQGNCDWYAKTALKQNQDNERMRCGFSGQSWSGNLRAHLTWCASVAPDTWKAEAQKRDQMLGQCATRASK